MRRCWVDGKRMPDVRIDDKQNNYNPYGIVLPIEK